jgi:hypothetical protein
MVQQSVAALKPFAIFPLALSSIYSLYAIHAALI